jgi:hypothetical protein
MRRPEGPSGKELFSKRGRNNPMILIGAFLKTHPRVLVYSKGQHPPVIIIHMLSDNIGSPGRKAYYVIH